MITKTFTDNELSLDHVRFEIMSVHSFRIIHSSNNNLSIKNIPITNVMNTGNTTNIILYIFLLLPTKHMPVTLSPSISLSIIKIILRNNGINHAAKFNW